MTTVQPMTTATPAGARATARIALLGASGYSGQEFARLALAHPGVELVCLVSREHAGRPGRELLVGAGRDLDVPVVAPDAALELVAQGAADTVVACLPHGTWRQLAPSFHAAAPRALRVIDLSADHRDGADGYVYAQPESGRAGLAGAVRIANPGCYPTAATLALLPALEQRWIDGPVMVSAVSGISGAGRSATTRTSFVEADGGAALYKAGTVHAHVAEMVRHFGHVAGVAPAVGFAPQTVPMARGILAVVHATLAHPVTPAAAQAVWEQRYADEPFLRVLPAGAWPETRAVRGSNRCDVAVTTMHDGRALLATAAIDNLVKGAAGQALQNLNLLLGWPETTALPVDGLPW